MTKLVRLNDYRLKQRRVFFSRPELNQLLSLYSRQVVRGEWRDYAIDQRDGVALFAVFRHSQESPLYTIVKTEAGAGQGRQRSYHLMHGRQRLASGRALGEILRPLQPSVRPIAVARDSEG